MISSVGTRHFRGYVVTFQQDSSTVSFGDPGDSGIFVKYCEVGFSSHGIHPVLFDKPRIGTESEVRLYNALQSAMKNLPKEEREKGHHNFYTLKDWDTISVYLIPGARGGTFVFGGSYFYQFVGGQLVAKQGFHLGYQFVKQAKNMGEVEVVSDLNTVPNQREGAGIWRGRRETSCSRPGWPSCPPTQGPPPGQPAGPS